MEAIEITVEERSERGTAAGERLRRDGKVPAVVYQNGAATQPVTLLTVDYRRSVSGKSAGQLYKFKSSSKSLEGRLALVKDLQIEPIKGQIQHLDFQTVDANKPIRVFIALELTGESAPVKLGEAILNVSIHELEIECLPTNIPSAVYADISSVTLGHSLHAKDVAMPEGTKLVSDPELPIVSVVAKKAEEVVVAPVAVAVAATPAAGAAKAPAGKAAPAADKKK